MVTLHAGTPMHRLLWRLHTLRAFTISALPCLGAALTACSLDLYNRLQVVTPCIWVISCSCTDLQVSCYAARPANLDMLVDILHLDQQVSLSDKVYRHIFSRQLACHRLCLLTVAVKH